MKILGVQTEFCREGGGVETPRQMGCGISSLFSEYEQLLRYLICIIFHHYLSWYPSEYHLRIIFDHSYCHLLIFGKEYLPKNVRLLKEGWVKRYLAKLRLKLQYPYQGLPSDIGNIPDWRKTINSGTFQSNLKLSRPSGNFPDHLEISRVSNIQSLQKTVFWKFLDCL